MYVAIMYHFLRAIINRYILDDAGRDQFDPQCSISLCTYGITYPCVICSDIIVSFAFPLCLIYLQK